MYIWAAAFGPGETIRDIGMGVEMFFFLSILIKLNTQFSVEGDIVPEVNISKIAENYFKNDLILDTIPLVPLQFIFP